MAFGLRFGANQNALFECLLKMHVLLTLVKSRSAADTNDFYD